MRKVHERLDAGSGSKRPDDRGCAPAPALRVAFLVTRDDLQGSIDHVVW